MKEEDTMKVRELSRPRKGMREQLVLLDKAEMMVMAKQNRANDAPTSREEQEEEEALASFNNTAATNRKEEGQMYRVRLFMSREDDGADVRLVG